MTAREFMSECNLFVELGKLKILILTMNYIMKILMIELRLWILILRIIRLH
jgi:hypothetical protein